ncbi:MAG: XRE family transcriptional regulator [Treponema sp.]|jgi:DNA-binding transcriptional regulator YiaG|nr:XRE family transcriptional regulator [Treponema sp.]
MKKKYKSEILEVIYQDAKAMFEVGGISKERMREYDRDCLVEEEETEAVGDIATVETA